MVQQYQPLRTIFVDGTPMNTAFLAVVLRKHKCAVEHRKVTDDEAVSLLASAAPLTMAENEPRHRLTIAQTSVPNIVLIHLKVSHALLDGVSHGILQERLQSALNEEGACRPMCSFTTRPSAIISRLFKDKTPNRPYSTGSIVWRPLFLVIFPDCKLQATK